MSAGRCVLCEFGDVSYVSWEMCIMSGGRCELCQLGDVYYVSLEM